MVKHHPVILPEDRMRLMTNIRRVTSTHDCPECHAPSYCAMEDGKSANLCWCMNIESVGKSASGTDTCLCRDCLTKNL